MLKNLLKLKNIWSLFLALFIVFTFSSITVFAEDDVSCTGNIVGKTDTTAASWNANSGAINFNDRGKFLDGHWTGVMINLAILKLTDVMGYAPPREYAACSQVDDLNADEFFVKGYAWDDNGGFVSMYCGSDGKNSSLNCGTYEYGVKVGVDGSGGAAGTRQLSGYAWSDTFGWVNFSGIGLQNASTGAFVLASPNSTSKVLLGDTYNITAGARFTGPSRVSITVNGVTKTVNSGATMEFSPNVFITVNSMSGVTPDNNITLSVDKPFNYGVIRNSDGSLTGSAYTEAGVYLVLDGVNLGLPGEDILIDSWCDGKAWICVELTPVPDDLSFDLDPIVEGGYPLADGNGAYTIHLYLRDETGTKALDPDVYDIPKLLASLDFSWKDSVKQNQLAGQEILPSNDTVSEPVLKTVNGAVVYKPVIKLFVTDFTQDKVDESHWVLNRQIASIAPTTNGNISKTTSLTKPTLFKNETFLYDYSSINKDGVVESNDLILKSINFTLKDLVGNVVTGVPNVIYANGVKDLPLKFRPVYELATLYVNDFEDKIEGFRGIPVNFQLMAKSYVDKTFAEPLLDFILDYDATQTVSNCSNDPANSVFDFHFLKDLSGKDLLECIACNDGEGDSLPECSISGCAKYPPTKKELLKQSFLNLITSVPVDLPAVATVPSGEKPCSLVTGPGLISRIAYELKFNEKVYKIAYYGNKIPRLGGSVLSNPAAVVHGNVNIQTSFNPSANVETSSGSSALNTNILKDTSTENLEKVLASQKSINGSGSTCTVGESVGGCSLGFDYLTFNVEKTNESVIYFKNSDVVLKNIGAYLDKVIVVEGGNVYIDGDLYDTDDSTKLSIVVLRQYNDKFADAGNIYIAPNVKNIQANIVSDGSIFSYSGNLADINATTGEPKWVSSAERAALLNKQLLIEGSISSRNTVGGADLDSPRSKDGEKAKTYLLLGTGEVLKAPISLEDRLRAQEYDLNYLRLFKLKLEVTADGLPIDQACGMGLTYDDILAINTDPVGHNIVYAGIRCDGIDPLNSVSSGGDLVVPDNIEVAKGLEGDDIYAPVYIYYVAPDRNSFIFSKSGDLNLGN